MIKLLLQENVEVETTVHTQWAVADHHIPVSMQRVRWFASPHFGTV